MRADAATLLDWYRANRRDLPWRRTRDPYRIWVSEVMLQQTRVDTVLGYYDRFLETFPTVDALAAADEEDVTRAWAGLGYYRRARLMHRAARDIAEAGRFPTTEAALRKLPGFGPYTAAAVASIAYDESAAAVDGNVERVAARILALEEDPRSPDGRRAVRAFVEGLHDEVEAHGDLTQALMELGALVCTPRNPACGACPWAGACRAGAAGAPEAHPVRPARRKPVEQQVAAAFVTRPGDGAVLLTRRERGLLAGVWTLPWVEVEEKETPQAAIARAFPDARVGREVARTRWTFTHRRWDLRVHRAEDVAVENGAWVAPEEVEAHGVAAAFREAFRAVRERPSLAAFLDD